MFDRETDALRRAEEAAMPVGRITFDLQQGTPPVHNPKRHTYGIPENDSSAGGGVKADAGKAPLSLIPRSALLAEARVLGFGAGKYSAHNWRKGMKWSRLSDAMMRHLLAWIDGEDLDPETGESHLAHLRSGAGFLIEYQEKSLGQDDRYHPKENIK